MSSIPDIDLLNFVFPGKSFQTQSIGLAAFLQLVGMRRTHDDINDVREFRQNVRERIQYLLNSFVGRKQPQSTREGLQPAIGNAEGVEPGHGRLPA